MIVLYEHPLSPYAQKCKIALAEKGIEFEARTPDAFGTGAVADKGFIENNPRHEVPMLVDGDARIFDSTVILEYLEDKWPKKSILPKDPMERARVRMLEDVMDTQYEAINWGILELTAFRRGTPDLRTLMLRRAAEQTAALQSWLEHQLGSRNWFNGASFGWGDIAVVPHLNISAGNGNGPSRGTKLADWLARANERPSVIATVKAVEAVMKVLPDLGQLVEAGIFRRQYRDHRLEWMMRTGGLPIVLEGVQKKTIRFSNETR
ncbi:MAG TPA: glutathione S-transferase family protein [Stellaceae bacterium]|nr:glutathione S-transferase family protein [Stellaceae bacterium]